MSENTRGAHTLVITAQASEHCHSTNFLWAKNTVFCVLSISILFETQKFKFRVCTFHDIVVFFSSISLLNFLLLKLAYCSKNWPFSNCFVSFNITGWTTVDKEFLVLSYRDVDTMGLFCSPYQNSVDFFSLCFCFFFHASSLIH